jgi:hypothetical protein
MSLQQRVLSGILTRFPFHSEDLASLQKPDCAAKIKKNMLTTLFNQQNLHPSCQSNHSSKIGVVKKM